MPPKHNLHTHAHTHTGTHTTTLANGCLCLRFCCFVCQLIWKLQQQQQQAERRCLMRKTLRYAPFSTCNTRLPAYPLPPLTHTHIHVHPPSAVCVCVCLPTCVAHCAHCLHISPKTVHCAYLNFTARCGFSSKRFHLPTCCAARCTTPTRLSGQPAPPPLARNTHHQPRNVRTQLVNNLRAALIEFNCTRRWGMRILIALTQVSCSSWGNLM